MTRTYTRVQQTRYEQEAGLTQAAIAETLGISASAVSQYKRRQGWEQLKKRLAESKAQTTPSALN